MKRLIKWIKSLFDKPEIKVKTLGNLKSLDNVFIQVPEGKFLTGWVMWRSADMIAIRINFDESEHVINIEDDLDKTKINFEDMILFVNKPV